MSGQPDPASPDDRGTPEGMQATDSSQPPEAGEVVAPRAAPAPDPLGASGPSVPPGPSARPAKRPTRRWLHWLKIVVVVIALPIIALLIGLLIAWIVHLIRGNPATHPAVTVNPPVASPAPRASASSPPAPKKAPPVVVPSDWVVESLPPVGLTFSHPPDWLRRTSSPEVLRFEPAAAGSTAPGIEGVGAGIEAAANPAQAIAEFGTRNYGTQPGFAATAVTPVAASTFGAHPGEQQGIVTYLRSGVEVRVVIHSFRSGTSTVLVMGRSAAAEPALAAQLEAFVEASIKVG
jgi:hypothetical protein